MRTVPLGQIAEIVSGATPKTSTAEYWDGEVEWATPADLSKLDGPYISDTSRKLTRAGVRSCSTTILPSGSVLLSSRAPIGHVAINAVPMATNQGFKSLVPGADLDAKYLYRWLKSKTAYLQSLGNGATFKELSKKTAEQIQVPLPPLAEQRRIAAILDHADALRAKRREVMAHLDALTHSLFRDTVGAEYWRAVSPATKGCNELGWSWVPLTDVSRLATGHTPDRKRPDYWDGGHIPWISLPEIRALDGKTAKSTDLAITEAGLANSSAVLLPAGTVCFSRTASVGFVTRLGVPMATSQDFHNWVPGPDLDSEFLMCALRYSRQHLLGVSDGSIHSTIYQRTAQRFQVLLPPITVQKEFSLRQAALGEHKAAVERILSADEELFASVQSRAFRGEL